MSNQTRNKRKTLQGVVSSRSGSKSVKVAIAYRIPHPRYTKVINRMTVVHAHDENDECKAGDKVEIMETRPLSKLKRWRVVSITATSADIGPTIVETSEALDGVAEKNK